MLDELSRHVAAAKANDLVSQLENRNTSQALAAEAELSMLWAISRVAHLTTEPDLPGSNRHPDALTNNLLGSGSAIVEVRSMSDYSFSGKEAMNRTANIITDYANRLRKGAGRHLRFEFLERSYWNKGFHRERCVDFGFKLSASIKQQLKAWIADKAEPMPDRIQIAAGKTDVVVSWDKTTSLHVRVFCRVPPYETRYSRLLRQTASAAKLDIEGSKTVTTAKGARMTAGEFSADEWIDRLARALPGLAEAQEPYLQEYDRQNPRVHAVYGGPDGDPPAFPLDDLQGLYLMGHHANTLGEQEYYAPLCAVLDPVRSILRSHPTLERVVSRIIGRDEFWVEILSSGSVTSLTNLIAGLMARAAELSGDRFRAAAGELNAFLTPAGKAGPTDMLGGLDVGYDAVLFYGLTLKERIEITDGMAMLPFEQAREFLDVSMVKELAPPGAVSHG